jgi:uncharacterized protein YbaR (Trm112 family)
VELLRCPITGKALKPAPEAVVSLLMESQRAGTLRNGEGAVPEPFEAGLLDDGEEWFYPIRTGIPVLLEGEAVKLAAAK